MIKNNMWTFSKHSVLSIIIVLISIIVDAATILGLGGLSFAFPVKLISLFNDQEAASIGIIGGVDGPTAIFLTGNPQFQTAISKCILLLIQHIDITIQ